MFYSFLVGGECLLDWFNLVGMDDLLAGETHLHTEECFLAQTIHILEINADHVDGLQTISCRRHHHSAAGMENLPCLRGSHRTDAGCKVFRSEDDGIQAGMCSDLLQVEDSGCSFDIHHHADGSQRTTISQFGTLYPFAD